MTIQRVYRNLHKQMWSCLVKGRVADRTSSLVLENCKFIVREKTRQRVIARKHKLVHAFVEGNRLHGMIPLSPNAIQISYNPYKYGHFYIKGSETPIYGADMVFMLENQQVFAINPR